MVRFLQNAYTIWQREIIRYLRDWTRIFSTFIQPLMFLAIFGAGLQNTLAASNFGIDYVQFMYPGIIAMTVMGVAFFSTISTVWDREFGFLKEILVAPVRRAAVAIGKTVGAATIASSQAFILLSLAPVIGVKLNLDILPKFILFMILLALAVSGLGLLIASLMKTTESFGLLMQILIFPMFFISGAFFPLVNVPKWMSWLADVNPLTYGVDALRQFLLDGYISQAVMNKISLHSIAIDGLFLVGFSILMVTAAVFAFEKRN